MTRTVTTRRSSSSSYSTRYPGCRALQTPASAEPSRTPAAAGSRSSSSVTNWYAAHATRDGSPDGAAWVRTRCHQALGAAVAVALLGGIAIAVAVTRPPGVFEQAYRIPVIDGPRHDQHIRLDATLFVPAGVDAGHRAPAVIVAHGFGGTKDSVTEDARALARHGYVVLAYTARGFPGSGGQIALDSPDYEVSDARQLIDWLATRPEVRLDGPGDPRVGVTGGSYGGALALMVAGHDRRVDAIAPLITWNDLGRAFFPDAAAPADAPASTSGVFKRLWAGLLFSAGASPGDPGAAGAADPGAGPGADPGADPG